MQDKSVDYSRHYCPKTHSLTQLQLAKEVELMTPPQLRNFFINM